jgi:ATP phosphoribosyltransferase
MLLTKDEFKIAIPSKGRLMDQSVEILHKAGMKFNSTGRQLFAPCSRTGFLVIFSNAIDIPLLVQKNFVDLGITGSDLVIEKKADVTEYLKLGFGKCRLSVATHKNFKYDNCRDLDNKIIGTKFTNMAENFISENKIQNLNVVEINGAVEVMILLDFVDAILDVVETGSSLREHDLVEREVLYESEAVLIGNKNSAKKDLSQKLARRMEGILVALKYSLLEYNCPSDRLEEAKLITPGYSSPTIQKTDSPDWYAVKVMVEKNKVQSIMDELESIGCRAILETEVGNCRL